VPVSVTEDFVQVIVPPVATALPLVGDPVSVTLSKKYRSVGSELLVTMITRTESPLKDPDVRVIEDVPVVLVPMPARSS
jgi:hypothetical protein